MSELAITALGIAAAALTTISQVPQVLKVWRTRSVEDLSLRMYLSLWLGLVLWLVYGLVLRDVPLILANGVSLVLVSVVLYFRVRYR
jgi:MtN3 and saliva related transmembrane protein